VRGLRQRPNHELEGAYLEIKAQRVGNCRSKKLCRAGRGRNAQSRAQSINAACSVQRSAPASSSSDAIPFNCVGTI
jgi:hypothetical protein